MAKLRVTAAARVLGIHPVTLRRWIASGRVKHEYSAAGQKVFDEDYLRALLEKQNPDKSDVTVFYTRVSGKNDSSLASQGEALSATYGEPSKVYSDTASGLKSDRIGLTKLLDDARDGQFDKVVVTHRDRLSRFGTEYIERLLNDYGVELIVDSKVTDEPQEVLMQDFMAILASFSGRLYAMRGVEQKKRLLARVEEELNGPGDDQ